MKKTKFRKKLYILLLGITICLLSACGSSQSESGDEVNNTSDAEETVQESSVDGTEEGEISDDGDVSDEHTDSPEGDDVDIDDQDTEASGRGELDFYGDYREEGGTIAYITGVSALEDGTYNSTVFEGIETYALGAGVSYSYYISASEEPSDCKEALDSAIACESHLVVVAGEHFNSIIGEYQNKYPDISFLLIDGIPTDKEGNPIEIAPNVHCVNFDEHEAGYLAGYLSTVDGYTQYGFIGGEAVEPVRKYGYGFVQGIEDASLELGNEGDILVNYWYSGTFLPSDEIYKTAADWYTSGIEVIFACGGDIYESILAAAEDKDGLMIGVDIDQNVLSDRVLTSAMKGVDRAVIVALDDYFAFNEWSDELAGVNEKYGIENRCPGLPLENWRFKQVTQTDYMHLYTKLRNGDIEVESDIPNMSQLSIKVVEW